MNRATTKLFNDPPDPEYFSKVNDIYDTLRDDFYTEILRDHLTFLQQDAHGPSTKSLDALYRVLFLLVSGTRIKFCNEVLTVIRDNISTIGEFVETFQDMERELVNIDACVFGSEYLHSRSVVLSG